MTHDELRELAAYHREQAREGFAIAERAIISAPSLRERMYRKARWHDAMAEKLSELADSFVQLTKG